MDPYDYITMQTLDLAEAARLAYKGGQIKESKDLIETIWYFLTKKLTSKKKIKLLRPETD